VNVLENDSTDILKCYFRRHSRVSIQTIITIKNFIEVRSKQIKLVYKEHLHFEAVPKLEFIISVA